MNGDRSSSGQVTIQQGDTAPSKTQGTRRASPTSFPADPKPVINETQTGADAGLEGGSNGSIPIGEGVTNTGQGSNGNGTEDVNESGDDDSTSGLDDSQARGDESDGGRRKRRWAR